MQGKTSKWACQTSWERSTPGHNGKHGARCGLSRPHLLQKLSSAVGMDGCSGVCARAFYPNTPVDSHAQKRAGHEELLLALQGNQRAVRHLLRALEQRPLPHSQATASWSVCGWCTGRNSTETPKTSWCSWAQIMEHWGSCRGKGKFCHYHGFLNNGQKRCCPCCEPELSCPLCRVSCLKKDSLSWSHVYFSLDALKHINHAQQTEAEERMHQLLCSICVFLGLFLHLGLLVLPRITCVFWKSQFLPSSKGHYPQGRFGRPLESVAQCPDLWLWLKIWSVPIMEYFLAMFRIHL